MRLRLHSWVCLCLLAAPPARAADSVWISEFMAVNGGSSRDQDGDASDWIELHNAGVAAVNLDGWRLTDDPGDLAKWTFPGINLAPGGFLLVFASGKDRAIAGAELHTRFQLEGAGEYLALVRPDGSIAHQYTPVFPPQPSDLSYGVTLDVTTNRLVGDAQRFKWLIPAAAAALPANWTSTNANDAGWQEGELGFGFDDGPEFGPFLRTQVGAASRNINASAFLRIPFLFDADEAPSTDQLVLRARYDDGFVAYLNGVEIARRYAPAAPGWNATATASRLDAAAVVFEEIEVTSALPLIVDGTNVLAIQALNAAANDGDLLCAMELETRSLALSERYFAVPTPGQANSATYLGVVADIKFSVDRGFYDVPFAVVLSNATPDASMRYTLNGSAPTLLNGLTYSAPIAVDRTTTLRARAFKTGYQSSDVDTHTYIFLNDVVRQDTAMATNRGFPLTWPGQQQDYDMDRKVVGPGDVFGGKFAASISNDLRSIATLSLVLDVGDLFGANGIYVNPNQHGVPWERVTSLELIETNGHGDQVNCGLRIQGNASRSPFYRKLSFRLIFKNSSGPARWHYPLFTGYTNATEEFDDLVLRGNIQDGWVGELGVGATYLRDTFLRETLLAMGGTASHQRWVHLYLNGLYWGVYAIIERPDASFSEAYFGGEKDAWDAITATHLGDRAANGDLDAWNAFLGLCRGDLTQYTNYLRLQGRRADGTRDPAWPDYLDVTNLIDYFILNFYLGTGDWGVNNFWLGRERTATATGFKFYPWDGDYAMTDLNRNLTSMFGGVTAPYAGCRQNAEFRMQFADRVQRHCFNGGALYVDPQAPGWNPAAPEHNVPAARWLQLADRLRSPLVGESARWGDVRRSPPLPPLSPQSWGGTITNLVTTFLSPRHAIVMQQFRSAGLYPMIDAPRFSQHGGRVPQDYSLGITNPNPAAGTIYYTLDGSDPRWVGDVLNPTATAYTGAILILRVTDVRARIRQGTNWSALAEARFVPPQDFSPLQLSEIMYNPPRAGLIDGDEFEFVEFFNTGDSALDLTGLGFSRGLSCVFSNGTILGSRQYLVLARNPAQFEARYGVAPGGLYAGKLDNNGETLALATALGDPVLSVAYNNAAPWPAEADNSGLSLQRMSFEVEATNALNWIAAAPTPGTGLPDEWADSDGDGMPDGWEQRNGFAPDANDAAEDADGDGLSNLEEFIAGTDPRVAGDVLRLQPMSTVLAGPNVWVELGFNARSNKTYTVTYAGALDATNVLRLANFPAAPTNQFVTVFDAVPLSGGPRYYRLASPKLP